jgi:hypothetical protein
MYQPVAHPVNGLQIKLIVSLGRDGAHVVTFHSVGNRFRINKVVRQKYYFACWYSLSSPELLSCAAVS